MAGEKVNRSYAIGGATSHASSYGKNSNKLETLGNKIRKSFLSSLKNERNELKRDDTKYHITKEDKESTLIAEWSGANDIATVTNLQTGNIESAKKQAHLAVQARLENVEKLIKSGYKNFALFNLPNLANTPRFNAPALPKGRKEEVSELSILYNKELAEGIRILSEKYKDKNCNIQCFDVDGTFNKIYNNPEEFGFNQDVNMQAANIEYTEGKVPLFNDDVHPSTQAHEIIAQILMRSAKKILILKLNQSFKI